MPRLTLVRPAALTTAFKPSTVAAPPLGVAYLAAAVRARGHDVSIVDAVGERPDQVLPLEWSSGVALGLSLDETVAAVPDDTDIIGMSCMFSSSWPYDRRLAQRLRRRFPKATIVLGGEHATAADRWLLENHPFIDLVVRGEGETTLTEWIDAVRQGKDWSHLSGLTLRRDGAVVRNPDRERIRTIDDILPPAWDLVPMENYLARGLNHGTSRRRSMPLLATRGCPYRCSFCSSPQMWTTRWESRSPDSVVSEMADGVRRYGAENFDLYDLTTIVDRRWIVAFARALIAARLNVTYQLASGTRTEAIDREVAHLLAQSGCTNITFAPESGSKRAIQRHHKKVDPEKMAAAIAACDAEGIRVSLNLILFPDDTRDDILETWRFALHCARLGVHDMSYFPYLPYPGSELYERLVTEGRLPEMSEEFFGALLDQFDLWQSRSYNPEIQNSELRVLRTLVLATFVLTAWVTHPRRPLSSVRHVLLGTPETRAEKTLSDIALRLPAIARIAWSRRFGG